MATNVSFTKTHEAARRGVSSYQAPNFPGTIYLGKAAFNGEHPDSFVIAEVPDPVAATSKRTKMTDEEKAAAKAAKAAMTPEQKAADRLAKAQAALAKAQAKAAQASAVEATA
jgi:hypothetical protein